MNGPAHAAAWGGDFRRAPCGRHLDFGPAACCCWQYRSSTSHFIQGVHPRSPATKELHKAKVGTCPMGVLRGRPADRGRAGMRRSGLAQAPVLSAGGANWELSAQGQGQGPRPGRRNASQHTEVTKLHPCPKRSSPLAGPAHGRAGPGCRHTRSTQEAAVVYGSGSQAWLGWQLWAACEAGPEQGSPRAAGHATPTRVAAKGLKGQAPAPCHPACPHTVHTHQSHHSPPQGPRATGQHGP